MSAERLLQLLEMLEESPRDSFLLFATAKEYENLGDPDQALDYFHLLLESDPAYVGLYYHLGKLLEKLDRTEEAAGIYQKGMEVANVQKDRHSYSELSGALLNLGME